MLKALAWCLSSVSVMIALTSFAADDYKRLELREFSSLEDHYDEIVVVVDSSAWQNVTHEDVGHLKSRAKTLTLKIEDICDKNCSLVLWPQVDRTILDPHGFVLMNSSVIYTNVQELHRNLYVNGDIDLAQVKDFRRSRELSFQSLRQTLGEQGTPALAPHFMFHHSFALAHLQEVHQHCIDYSSVHVLVPRVDVLEASYIQEDQYGPNHAQVLHEKMTAIGHTDFSVVKAYSFELFSQSRRGNPYFAEEFIPC